MFFIKTVVIVLAAMTAWHILRLERVPWLVVGAAAIIGILCYIPGPRKEKA